MTPATPARIAVVLAVPLLALTAAACATEPERATAGTGPTVAGTGPTAAGTTPTAAPTKQGRDPQPPELPRTELKVSVDPGNRNPMRWTLTCDPPGGDHPLAERACELLAQFAGQEVDPFAPPRKDRACPEVYGGPDTATVSGVWRGRPVQASFSRVDGCEISRWDKLGPLFGGAGSR